MRLWGLFPLDVDHTNFWALGELASHTMLTRRFAVMVHISG